MKHLDIDTIIEYVMIDEINEETKKLASDVSDMENEAIMEIELASEDQKVTIPEFIEVLDDVTDKEEYKKNSKDNIAGEFWEEITVEGKNLFIILSKKKASPAVCGKSSQ